MPKYEMSDVIVLLPGIPGSVLRKFGRIVWGYDATTIGMALFTHGESLLKDLALPSDDCTIDDLGDGVNADALMPDLHLLPGLWKIDGYTKVREGIEATFDVTAGQNFFPFPYDWRRDNRVAARKLKPDASGWLEKWRSAGHPDAKLILIGHSMGGLISRAALCPPVPVLRGRYHPSELPDARHCRRKQRGTPATAPVARGKHPEPLTDPDLILSPHPARAPERRLPHSVTCSPTGRSKIHDRNRSGADHQRSLRKAAITSAAANRNAGRLPGTKAIKSEIIGGFLEKMEPDTVPGQIV
jgi:hypothetical protein